VNQVTMLQRTASPTTTRAQTILLKAPSHGAIARDALRFLRSSNYSELRTIQCESRDDVLILRGQVSTFFMKQLAQERIRSMEGVRAVINDLQVVDPNS
jgi:osmotically-inducible protein OsmY